MSLALYRRFRPETFAEVIGQEHVTEPLQQALRNNRVNHAYLFSGPRGCGKTTSARILARALNCEQGPTPTPCGTCQSCLDLARNGPGSIDVIEIDAASHGGVDDARDLRERAFFAPAASRYKIYIVDEAHMVTSAGFNALLKVVEEPPEHLKFIFATTEPEKVIGTIRSRTHHYPFRLIPPSVLRDYLDWVCRQEDVVMETGVVPLVVRAGAGSVRDAMSVLDQLIAGAGDQGVTYAMATALLGYTDDTLLDDVVDAFAAHDGAAVFTVVDRVIEGGHDPRRFVADLLERFRDLVILAAVPDAAGRGLIDRPEDQLERMRAQAAHFGQAELSRAADLVNTGLTEMRGATAPRLQLELICARVLLPGAHDDERGVASRLDRLERRLTIGSAPADGAGPAGPPRPAAQQPAAQQSVAQQSVAQQPTRQPVAARPVPQEATSGQGLPGAPAASARSGPGPGPGPGAARLSEPEADPAAAPPGLASAPGSVASGPVASGTSGPPASEAEPSGPPASDLPASDLPASDPPASRPSASDAESPSREMSSSPAAPSPAAPGPPAAEPAPAAGGLDTVAVRRGWPQVLDAVKHRRRFTWILLSQNAQVVGLEGAVLSLAFVNGGARDSFVNSGSEDILREALQEALGVDWRIESIVDPSSGGGHDGGHDGGGSGGPGPSHPRPSGPQPPAAASGMSPPPGQVADPVPGASADWGTPPGPPPRPAERSPGGPSPASARLARAALSDVAARPVVVAPEDDVAAEDDPDVDDEGLTGHELVRRELGAVIIDEFENS